MEISGLTTQLGECFCMVLDVLVQLNGSRRCVSLTILHCQMYLLAVLGAVGAAAAVTARARVTAHFEEGCCWGLLFGLG